MNTKCSPGRLCGIVLLLVTGTLAQVRAGVPEAAAAGGGGSRSLAAGPSGRSPKPGAGPSSRQKSLAHFRKVQLEIRNYKKRQRVLRRQEALARAEGSQAPVTLDPPTQPHDPSVRQAIKLDARSDPRLAAGGLFCLSLLGLAALAEPSTMGAWAQGSLLQPGPAINATALVDRYMAETTVNLAALGPVCLAALVAGPPLPPCAPSYRTGLLGQVQELRAEMLALFVTPASLGAGACLKGDSPKVAKARIRLDQGDILAAFDALSADAATLQYQMGRDGYALQGAANGLFTLQDAAKLVSGGSSGVAADAAFSLGQVGTSLYGAGFGLEALGDLFATLANTAISYKGRYLKWANGQMPALLQNCTGTALTRASGTGTFTGAPPSPLPALEEALLKLTAGCLLAQQQHLDLPVCSPDALMDLHGRNGTVADLYQDLICLSSDTTSTSHMACPSGPSPDNLLQSSINAQFGQYQAEMNAVGFLAQGLGNALFAASQAVLVSGNAASQAGNREEGEALSGVEAALMVFGRAIFANGFELQRISAVSRRWLADVTRAFNAEHRSQLDEAGPGASSTGTAGMAASGTFPTGTARGASSTAVPGPVELPGSGATPATPGGDPDAGLGPLSSSGLDPAWSSSGRESSGGEGEATAGTGVTDPDSSSASEAPSSNGAARRRPLLFGGIALLLSPRPALPAADQDEL